MSGGLQLSEGQLVKTIRNRLCTSRSLDDDLLCRCKSLKLLGAILGGNLEVVCMRHALTVELFKCLDVVCKVLCCHGEIALCSGLGLAVLCLPLLEGLQLVFRQVDI